MANNRAGNIQYIDSTGVISEKKGVKVFYIYISGSTTSPNLELSDPVSGALLFKSTPGVTGSEFLDYSAVPLIFPNGLEVTAINNVVAMLTLREGT